MKKRGFLHLVLTALVFLVLVVGLVFVKLPTAVAQEPPPERPEPPPERPEPPGRPEPPEVGPGLIDGISPVPCSDVYGVVINWGYRNEPKLPVQLSGGDWQALKLTDDNGYYAFQCLGIGVGLLNLTLPPGCNPFTENVAIRLGHRDDQEVNLGLYGGQTAPTLPLTFTMTADRAGFRLGETVTYQVRVVNNDQDVERHLSGVLITDLLPEELEVTDVSTTQGTVELWGNLVTADIGALAIGESVTVSIKAMIREGVPAGTSVTNKASLIYEAGIAQQTAPLVLEVVSTAF